MTVFEKSDYEEGRVDILTSVLTPGALDSEPAEDSWTNPADGATVGLDLPTKTAVVGSWLRPARQRVRDSVQLDTTRYS